MLPLESESRVNPGALLWPLRIGRMKQGMHLDEARRVLIVGGGSTGGMAAAYLNAALNFGGRKLATISVVESPDVPRIGVGEATIPSINHLLAVIGIDELDFMRRVDGTYKQSIRFVNWMHGSTSPWRSRGSVAAIRPGLIEQLRNRGCCRAIPRASRNAMRGETPRGAAGFHPRGRAAPIESSAAT